MKFKAYDQSKGNFDGFRSPGEKFLYFIYHSEKIFTYQILIRYVQKGR